MHAHLSPTLDYRDAGSLRCAVSIDNEPPQIVNMHADSPHAARPTGVSTNVVITSRHQVDQPGEHVLMVWMVDPGIVPATPSNPLQPTLASTE